GGLAARGDSAGVGPHLAGGAVDLEGHAEDDVVAGAAVDEDVVAVEDANDLAIDEGGFVVLADLDALDSLLEAGDVVLQLGGGGALRFERTFEFGDLGFVVAANAG